MSSAMKPQPNGTAPDIATPRFGTIPGVWLRPDSPLSHVERYVLCLFGLHASRDEHECYPSQQRLADEGKLSRETVNRAIQGLVEHGALEVVRRRRDTSLYRVIGYDAKQSVTLPWVKTPTAPSSDPQSHQDSRSDLDVTGTKIGSTTYATGSDPRSHEQIFNNRTRETAVATRELRTASRARQENHNPPTTLPADAELVSQERIVACGHEWRDQVGLKPAPIDDEPPHPNAPLPHVARHA